MNILDKDFTFVDLFSGIGGFHYAMKKISKDAKCVFASEINPNAVKVYKDNFNINSNFDIRHLKGVDIPKFDVLCAGFPCQPFSKAGAQLGFTHENGVLFNEIERLIDEKIKIGQKPKILILENVKNLISHDNYRTWAIIKEKIINLGYNIVDKPIVIGPHHLGIPQLRERAIILAVDKNLFADEIMIKIPEAKTKKTIYDILEPIDEDELKDLKLTNYQIKVLDAWNYFINNLNVKTIGFPIWSDDFTESRDISTFPDWKKSFVLKNRKLYNDNKEMIDFWRKEFGVDSFVRTHRKFEWQAGTEIESVYQGIIQFRTSGIRVKRPNNSPTLVAMTHIPIVGRERRYLSPREACNLQSFPRNFKFNSVGHDIYRLLGNSVNVDVICTSFASFIKLINRKD